MRIDPASAGWNYAGLQVIRLEPGIERVIATEASEYFVLPLSGGLTIEVTQGTAAAPPETAAPPENTERFGTYSTEGEPLEAAPTIRFELTGRDSVFGRVTDFAYVGRDSQIRLVSSAGAEVALPSARCERRLPPRYGPAEEVSVEVRGAGPATRQVTNFGSPGAWAQADRLIACELITPAGNWSSYPPHKHDATDPCQVQNEELYFFRIAGPDGVTPTRQGFGLHRTFTGPEHAAAGLADLDETLEVRDLDVFCIPHGYHGPCVAAPGYDMYYLNVLAGPATGPARSMAFCDHPEQAWVRDTWSDTPADPRCPVTSAEGRVSRRPTADSKEEACD